jgi:hypothetical protein
LLDQITKEKQMNRFESIKKPLMWLMPLLLAALVTGCGGSSSSGIADTTAPTISSTVPANGATAVAINSKITANFSKAMNPATINTTTFTVATSAVPAVPVIGTVGLDDTGKIAIFTPPVGNFAASTVYNATLTTGAKDKAGNALAIAKTWSFTTGTTADTTLPTVISTSPADLATGVVINTDVTAIFSKAMNPSTINNATFTLKQGYSPVPGAVTYLDGLNGKATFHPTNNLAANTTYIAAVTTGARDLAGNTTSTPGDIKKWSFTTGSGNVVVVPPPVLPANPAAVILGTAANYAILAKTGVATVPSSIVTGNVGLSPAARTYLTGWSLITEPTDTYFTSAQVVVPFKLYAADQVGGTTSADLGTAVLNMQAAYTDAAGRTATSAATTNVGAGTLTSLTLTRGVYEWGSNVTIPTDLTLNGSATDVWIFKIAGTLTMAAAKNVILTGGALPKNVFWQVSNTVNIGANTHFSGIILGKTIITLGNLSSIDGRLLAQTDVNVDATTVTQPAP